MRLFLEGKKIVAHMTRANVMSMSLLNCVLMFCGYLQLQLQLHILCDYMGLIIWTLLPQLTIALCQ
jgi:hypoxanthine-guanine phosphoribosyltransferase